MIYDNEKCRITLPNGPQFGMYESLRDIGITTEGGTNGEFASDPVVAQAFINAWTADKSLVWAKAKVSLDIVEYAKMLRDAAISMISCGELAAWPIKRDEAIAYSKSGSASDAPMLSMEAQSGGITLPDLISRVSANVTKFSSLEASIGGTSRKHRDVIGQMVSADDVMSYNWRNGWPVL